jgi:hypothetical protein
MEEPKSNKEVILMNTNKTNGKYDVLNPWAEVDPVPLRGISPRLTELNNKTVGLFCSSKPASRPTLTIVERKLRERFPSLKFSWFLFDYNLAISEITETKDKARLEEWIKGIDAAVTAIGD